MARPAEDSQLAHAFQVRFRSWAESFCAEKNQLSPPKDWFARTLRRLPPGLQQTIEGALKLGAIQEQDGSKFSVPGSERKGPYQWFSNRFSSGGPNPNWEYFVQSAEYARLWKLLSSKPYRLEFEHDRMDIAVIQGRHVILAIEVKENFRQLDHLIRDLNEIGNGGINRAWPARMKNARRKGVYLVKHRAPYFSATAIGKRYDFMVQYSSVKQGERFELIHDLIPLP